MNETFCKEIIATKSISKSYLSSRFWDISYELKNTVGNLNISVIRLPKHHTRLLAITCHADNAWKHENINPK